MFGLDSFGLGLFCLAVLGTFIYTTKMLLMVVFGLADDELMDLDFDDVDLTADVDTGDNASDLALDDSDDSGSSFTWLSLNVVTSFIMLFGWFGLGTYQWLLPADDQNIAGLAGYISRGFSIFVGAAAGILGVKINTWVIKQIIKFQHSGTMNINNLIGQKGKVYIRISPDKAGAIMIEADNGILMEMIATTNRKETINTGERVKVIEIENGKLVVEPVSSEIEPEVA